MLVISSMALVSVNQLWHGYRRGHELLAQSVKLDSDDLDEIARLSDLSGLQTSDSTPSHITCYPLPSGRYYALAKTWLDTSAPRKGCVLTHTLLIAMDDWSRGASAQVLAKHLKLPDLLAPNGLQALKLEASKDVVQKQIDVIPGIESFCEKFFVQGLRPIIWPIGPDDADRSASILIRLLDVLWPSRRTSFTGSSYTLQPRKLLGEAFALMLVPSSAIGRFSSMQVGSSVRVDLTETRTFESRDYRIIHGFVNLLLEGRADYSQDLLELVADLPSSPNALSKIAILDDLYLRGPENPRASVAALDVIGALAHGPHEAVKQKRWIARNAIDSASLADNFQSIELFSGISLRLARPPFRKLSDLRQANRIALRSAVERGIEGAIEVAQKIHPAPRALIHAIGTYLQNSNRREDTLIELSWKSSWLLERVLSLNPSIVPSYISDSISSDSGPRFALANAEEWISKITSRYRRNRICRAMISTVEVYESDFLASNVLSSAYASDTGTVLSALNRVNDGRLTRIGDPIFEFLQVRFNESLDYYRSNLVSSEISAQIVAWLSIASEEFNFALHLDFSSSAYRDIAYGSLLQSRAARRNPSVANKIFSDALKGYAEWSNLLGRNELTEVLSFLDLSSLDIYQAPQVASLLSHDNFRSVRKPFVQWTLNESVSKGYPIPSSAAELVNSELRTLSYLDVRSLLKSVNWSRSAPASSWSVFSQIVEALVDRDDVIGFELLRHLLEQFGDRKDLIEGYWMFALRALEDHRKFLPVALVSLDHALESPSSHVEQIVDICFDAVYRSLPTSDKKGLVESWIWPATVNRRRDLQLRLVESFVNSEWPYSLLAEIAYRNGFLDFCLSELSSSRYANALEELRDEVSASNDHTLVHVREKIDKLKPNSKSVKKGRGKAKK